MPLLRSLMVFLSMISQGASEFLANRGSRVCAPKGDVLIQAKKTEGLFCAETNLEAL